jgi:hypothetical protein
LQRYELLSDGSINGFRQGGEVAAQGGSRNFLISEYDYMIFRVIS